MKKQLKESHKFQLPKCCQQPRSGGPKPRTDFTESVWSSSGSDLESLICNQSMPTATTTGMSQEIYHLALRYDKQMHKTFPIHCVSVDEGHRVPFAISLDSRAELNPVSREKFVDVDSIGLLLRDQGDPCADFSSEKFVSTPINKSHGTDSKNARESVAWEKLTKDGGWPAEALNKNETVNSSLDGDKTRCMPMTPIQVHEYSGGNTPGKIYEGLTEIEDNAPAWADTSTWLLIRTLTIETLSWHPLKYLFAFIFSVYKWLRFSDVGILTFVFSLFCVNPKNWKKKKRKSWRMYAKNLTNQTEVDNNQIRMVSSRKLKLHSCCISIPLKRDPCGPSPTGMGVEHFPCFSSEESRGEGCHEEALPSAHSSLSPTEGSGEEDDGAAGLASRASLFFHLSTLPLW
ncbi:hypothetical protein EJ110_NYTH30284 [Nymphaea thermarum]|nr:hypothetical protein EJ110_NYTH30284 [Nymphaea thermarum]